jgi:hypothetical protein
MGGFWLKSQKERDQYSDLDVLGNIIIKFFIEKYYGVVLTKLIWLRIRTSGGIFEHGNEP